MKIKNLQKRTVIEAGIALGVIAVVTGIHLGVSAWASGQTSGKTDIENKFNQQQAEINTLRSKIDNAGSSQKTYANIVEKRGNDHFTIENDRVRSVLESLIARYRLSILGKLEYSAEAKLDKPEFANLTTGFVVRKTTSLKFSAISDLHAYAFVNALTNELPGIVQINYLKVTRKGQINNNALAQLSLGKEVYLVDATVDFDWYGAVPAPAKASAASDTSAPAPAPGAPAAPSQPGGPPNAGGIAP